MRNAREQALSPPSRPPIMHSTYLAPWWLLCKIYGSALALLNLWNTPTSSWTSNHSGENPLEVLPATPPWSGGGARACAPLAFSCLLEKFKEKEEKKGKTKKEKERKERKKERKKDRSACLKCAGVVCPTSTLTTAAPSELAAWSCPCRPTAWL